jgi:two-component sensor histidine kinase
MKRPRQPTLRLGAHHVVTNEKRQGLFSMSSKSQEPEQVERLLRRERALADFGTFAFRENDLQVVLDEAARVCAECLGASYSKICRFQPTDNHLLVVAGHGWKPGVVGFAISVADESSPQGRAFTTGEPQLCANIDAANTYSLPAFYKDHNVLSTVDVLVAAKSGPPFGVLEVDSRVANAFETHDIDFLKGFGNILAEAVVSSRRAADLRETITCMERLVEEKEILAQELKHRVRNSLHLVYGLLSVELDGEHPAGSVEAIRSIALRVMGLAEVFDHLLGVGMSKIINLGTYVKALCETLPELYKQPNVKLNADVESVYVALDDAMPLGIIITELINNAYLHAFPGGAGEINVSLRVATGSLALTISDNGIGFVEEVESKRRGMGLVKGLVRQLGATLVLQSDSATPQSAHGTTWLITSALSKVYPMAA